MIAGIGVDITDIPRITRAQQRNAHFARKVLGDAEYARWQTLMGKAADAYLAGRFSVKEAYAKARGTGLGAISLHEVQVLNDDMGRPVIVGGPHEGPAHVSISHTDALVMTEVILEVAD